MHSFQSPAYKSQFKTQTLDFHPLLFRISSIPARLQRFRTNEDGVRITMSNRRRERRPLQRGRNLSIEAMLAVQALKRAKNDPPLLDRLFDSKVRRLIKFDLMALLRELQRQNEALLALQVFEEIRKEYWYKAQASVYAGLITVLASNGFLEKVWLLFSYLRAETVEADDTEGFNALLRTLMEFGIYEISMECLQLMKEVGCDPDESTFRILINGFQSQGQTNLSEIIWQEAEKYFGESPEFLLEKEEGGSSDMTLRNHN